MLLGLLLLGGCHRCRSLRPPKIDPAHAATRRQEADRVLDARCTVADYRYGRASFDGVVAFEITRVHEGAPSTGRLRFTECYHRAPAGTSCVDFVPPIFARGQRYRLYLSEGRLIGMTPLASDSATDR